MTLMRESVNASIAEEFGYRKRERKKAIRPAAFKLKSPQPPKNGAQYRRLVVRCSRGSVKSWEEPTALHDGSTVDDLVATPELRRGMMLVQTQQLAGRDWRSTWSGIATDVRDATKRATEILSPFGVTKVTLHDGYVGEITVAAEALARDAAILFALAPRVRHLHVEGSGPFLDALLSLEFLRSMYSLGLRRGGLTDADIEKLVGSRYLTRLLWLDLGENEVTDRGLETLATARDLDRLLYVALDGNPCRNPFDVVLEDGGQILGTRPTPFGSELEARALRSPLAWLHAPSHFGPLYPPSPYHAELFAQRIASVASGPAGTTLG